MGKQIGIYGGSFDPIHLGHLNLAMEMLELRQLDEIWFCPAYLSPHKYKKSSVSAEHRLEMIRLAIQGQSKFFVSDVEIKRQEPSYTAETLRFFSSLYKQEPFFYSFSLILGEDQALVFEKWHEPREIIRHARLLIGKRSFKASQISHGDPLIIKAIEEGLTPTRIMEISSSEIRERLSKGSFCGHLLPGKVLDYILLHRLYFKDKLGVNGIAK